MTYCRYTLSYYPLTDHPDHQALRGTACVRCARCSVSSVLLGAESHATVTCAPDGPAFISWAAGDGEGNGATATGSWDLTVSMFGFWVVLQAQAKESTEPGTGWAWGYLLNCLCLEFGF